VPWGKHLFRLLAQLVLYLNDNPHSDGNDLIFQAATAILTYLPTYVIGLGLVKVLLHPLSNILRFQYTAQLRQEIKHRVLYDALKNAQKH
jgi:hypothetical protein